MRKLLAVSAALFLPCAALAQADFLDNVRPMMAWARTVEDGALAQPGYAEGQFTYLSGLYEELDGFALGGRGAYAVTPLIEVGGLLRFASVSNGDSESGLLDPDVYGKYALMAGAATRITAGCVLNLPLGSDKLSQQTFDFGAVGALRHALPQFVILGHFGFRVNGDVEGEEVDEDDWDDWSTGASHEVAHADDDVVAEGKLSILFGGGVIYQINPQFHFTGELVFETERYEDDESLIQLVPGIDYQLASGLKLRGALALGLSDAVPEFQLVAGVAMPFGG